MQSISDLVRAAADGDQRAWSALVKQFNGLLWSIARGYRLGTAESEEVVSTAWLRLVEHIGRLREPEYVGAWLATTTRRECVRALRRAERVLPTDDDAVLDRAEPGGESPEDEVLRLDRDHELWLAVQSLSDRCTLLLRVLATAPPPSYQEVSAALGLPVGSIGPTRARCLAQLKIILSRGGYQTPD
ncbi:MAG: RNA polymerase sigma factor [Egibacteraceae bacterium]